MVALSLERAVAVLPAQRYETAEEWLLVLEQADRRELSVRPRPLLEREPLKVWQTLAVASLLGSPGVDVLAFAPLTSKIRRGSI